MGDTPRDPGERTVRALLEPDRGRWWVVLEVTEPATAERPGTVHRHRIADYPTQRAARVAARWMRRGADRTLPLPPTGF